MPPTAPRWAAAARRAMRQHKIAAALNAAGLALAAAAIAIGLPGQARGAGPRMPGFTLPALGHPGGHAVIGVDANDATAAALSFVRDAGVTYPAGVDRTAATAVRSGVVAIPQTFFLDSSRHIIRRVFGAVTLVELTRDTAQLTAISAAR
jgi:hypothetical protein